MPAAEVAARVRESLASLKASDLQDAQVMEVLKLAQQLTDTMQMFFGSLDRSIHQEFCYIADYISKTRDEISKLHTYIVNLTCAARAHRATLALTRRRSALMEGKVERRHVLEDDGIRYPGFVEFDATCQCIVTRNGSNDA